MNKQVTSPFPNLTPTKSRVTKIMRPNGFEFGKTPKHQSSNPHRKKTNRKDNEQNNLPRVTNYLTSDEDLIKFPLPERVISEPPETEEVCT